MPNKLLLTANYSYTQTTAISKHYALSTTLTLELFYVLLLQLYP